MYEIIIIVWFVYVFNITYSCVIQWFSIFMFYIKYVLFKMSRYCNYIKDFVLIQFNPQKYMKDTPFENVSMNEQGEKYYSSKNHSVLEE